MHPPFLPADQAVTLTPLEQDLLVQFSQAVHHHFHATCDQVTQTFLTQCQWSISIHLDVPTLTIICPNAKTYWNIVGNIERISEYLSRIVRVGRIEVIPRSRKNICFEVEVTA